MPANLAPLGTVLVFASLNESIIEYLFGSIAEIRPYLPLISLGFGILLSFSYQINLFQMLLGLQSGNPLVDYLLSGFVISRGSNFVNDFAQKALGSK